MKDDASFSITCLQLSRVSLFVAVYDMGIATILQCFVADEEMFNDDQMYAEGSLKSWVDSYGSK